MSFIEIAPLSACAVARVWFALAALPFLIWFELLPISFVRGVCSVDVLTSPVTPWGRGGQVSSIATGVSSIA